MALSNIEAALTKHIRSFLQHSYSTSSLKKVACLISLISCLCAGSVLLFSLFTPVLQNQLHYSQLEINIIGSFTSIGMYLPLPVLGYLADCHGPVLLSIISVIMFSPAYLLAAVVVQNDSSFWYLATSFAFIGCATSALYFTALLTCAKIYPKSKGLTISAPVTCFGLSSLIGSQVLKLRFLRKGNELDLYKCFRFFSILYFFLGLFNWISASVVTIERDVLLRKHEDGERTPLLEDQPDQVEINNDEGSDDLVSDHKTKFLNFLKDSSTYILLFSLLLSIGPSEMYITNMGSLVETISPKSSISDQVSIHAVFSTLSRLSLGALSDYLVTNFKIPRSLLLLAIILIGLITQLLIACSIFVADQYYVISALSGITYGGLFTLYPTVIFSTWGPEIFGSAWGSFMIAPAVGSTSFGLVYGLIYDSSCKVIKDSMKQIYHSNCASLVFWINSIGFILSAVSLVFAWKGIWSKRGISLL